MNIRAIAAGILAKILAQEQSLSDLLPYQQTTLDSKDEALLQALCYGVCRWQVRLDSVAQQLLEKPLKPKDYDIRALLLLGLYQLLFTRVPAHAAVGETVQATKSLGKPWAKGLINAVLRRFQREQEKIIAAVSITTEYEFSHPKWLLSRLQQAWPEDWQKICHANNTKAPMTLRVNQQQSSTDEYLAKIAAMGIKSKPRKYSPAAIQLAEAVPVDLLPDFRQGAASVQDEAAQLAPELMDLSPDMRVLDACAAPGGKTCHLLEAEPKIAELVALELDQQRSEKITENLRRLQLTATLVNGDAANPKTWWDNEPFDRILLDAPCSAIGVIRRHPDIKLLRRNADIDKLATQQLKMLEALWALLKPGGMLVYATCSILPQENDFVIHQFLSNTLDAANSPIEKSWGVPGKYGRYLLPIEAGNDGFYYARLAKAKSQL